MPSGRVYRISSLIAAAGLLTAGLVILPGAPASAATPGIALAKQAPAKVLAGAPVAFTLTASIPAATRPPRRSTTSRFRERAAEIGLATQAGSDQPVIPLGDPTVITDGVTGQQTLLSPDAFDLQVAAISAISFATAVNAGALPVGQRHPEHRQRLRQHRAPGGASSAPPASRSPMPRCSRPPATRPAPR